MGYKELPKISNKQKKIMELVAKFRFINRQQIQKFLGHKGAHRINVWLKDLVDKKYLGRIYSRKLLENTKPSIYFLHNNGILWTKLVIEERVGDYSLADKMVKKMYADKNASQLFIDHSIAVCELYMQFKELEGTKWDFECFTKADMHSWFSGDDDFDLQKKYYADIYVDKMSIKMDESAAFFVDLFPAHIPRYALEYRVRQYIELYSEVDNEAYRGHDGLFPNILFIITKQGQINRLAGYIRDVLDYTYDNEEIVFALTTHKKAFERGVGDNTIWKVVKAEM